MISKAAFNAWLTKDIGIFTKEIFDSNDQIVL
jgi:hypothetical protein